MPRQRAGRRGLLLGVGPQGSRPAGTTGYRAPISRCRASASATREVSIVIQRRPHCSATNAVVPRAAGRIEHQIARVSAHQHAPLDHLGDRSALRRSCRVSAADGVVPEVRVGRQGSRRSRDRSPDAGASDVQRARVQPVACRSLVRLPVPLPAAWIGLAVELEGGTAALSLAPSDEDSRQRIALATQRERSRSSSRSACQSSPVVPSGSLDTSRTGPVRLRARFAIERRDTSARSRSLAYQTM